MDYYSKYIKYKTKYLELKGGKLEYGLYGLYSWVNNNQNLRKNNNRFNEINYVHNLPLYKNEEGNLIDPKIINLQEYKDSDNIIIQHLRSKCTIVGDKITAYYPGVQSFEFVPYDGVVDEDIKKIRNLIDTTYFTDKINNIEPLRVTRWTTLNKLKKFRYRGYSNEISEKIINTYADKAEELLQNENNYKSDIEGITEIRQKALKLRSLRRCDQIHKYPDEIIEIDEKKIILENLIPDNNRQLLLSSVSTGRKYEKNPKIYKDPYTLANEKLGILSWNIIINKATMSCLMNHHDVLFPIRIILDMNPEKLFYDNLLQTKKLANYIIENNKYSNYMGFFLIRFIRDQDYDTLHSKTHKSKEQYYIFFIFKNENQFFDFPLFTYTLTNFRNNIVNWGTVIEKKTVLYYEILQLICMYLKKDVYFYLVSKSESKNESKSEIYKWIHTEDLEKVNFDNEIHILVSKHNIETIAEKLQIKNEGWSKKRKKRKKDYKYIEYDEIIEIKDDFGNITGTRTNSYELTECHFGYYDDPYDRFCIKLGDMSDEQQTFLGQNACINDINSSMYKLDKIRNIQPIGKNNVIDIEDIDKFDFRDNPIMYMDLKDILKI